MSDVRDILSLPSPTAPRLPPPRPISTAKPDSISRELYNLIGGGGSITPAIQINTAISSNEHRERRKWRKERDERTGGERWIRETRQFTMILSHQAQSPLHELTINSKLKLADATVVEEDNTEAPTTSAAKFNVRIDVPFYTDIEYDTYFRDHHWSRAETDYLFDLCRQYDLRFIVIADRYDWKEQPNRSMEDLKARYYPIMKQMQLTRAQTQESSIYNYNPDRERQRKMLTERLYNRTQAQIQEEEMLIIHLRKMELNYKRSAHERERILRLLNSGEYGHHPMEEAEEEVQSKHKDKRKRHISREYAIPGTPMSASPIPKLPVGVFLRSQRPLPSSKSQSQQSKLMALLAEFNIPERPHMPTQAVCTAHEEIRMSLMQLLELKRQCDRLDQEIRIAETRKHGGAAAEKGRKRKNTADYMDVDDNRRGHTHMRL